MNITPRVKFNATLNASGDIVMGSALAGYVADPNSLNERCVCLLEKGAAYELVVHDPSRAAGQKRKVAGSTVFAANEIGLICSFVAPPSSYVVDKTNDNTGEWNGPVVDALTGLAIGRVSSVDSDSNGAISIQGQTAYAKQAVVIGGTARVKNAVVIGVGAVAGDPSSDNATGMNAVSIGKEASASVPGEVSLGNRYLPHVEFLPLGIDIPTATTARLRAVADYDSSNSAVLLTDIPSNYDERIVPYEINDYVWRMTGTIIAQADSSTHSRVFAVDWTYSNFTNTVLHSSFTVLQTGGAGTITLSADSSGYLQVTTAGAYAGLKLRGVVQMHMVPFYTSTGYEP